MDNVDDLFDQEVPSQGTGTLVPSGQEALDPSSGYPDGKDSARTEESVHVPGPSEDSERTRLRNERERRVFLTEAEKRDYSDPSVKPPQFSEFRTSPQSESSTPAYRPSSVLALSHIGMFGDQQNKYQAPLEIREFVFLLSNGQLYLSRDHVGQNSVTFYANKMSELFRKDFQREIKKSVLNFDELRNLVSKTIGTGQIRTVENANQQRIHGFIRDAMTLWATDMHWKIAGGEARISFRIGQELVAQKNLSHAEGLELAGTIYQGMLQVSDSNFKKDVWQEGQWKAEMLPKELSNIRYSHRPIQGGLKVALRLQYRNLKTAESLEAMGYSEDHIAMIEYMILRSNGLFLVSGPMGSAKSSLLVIILGMLKKKNPGWCVAAIEDPPEFDIAGVEQSKPPFDSNGNPSFSEGLKRLLRHDVNAFMVGEIRDYETAKTAFEISLTGHPIWSTLHANSGVHVMSRLEEMESESGAKISRAKIYDHTLLGGMIAQRLIPLLCPKCREPVQYSLDGASMMRKLELAGIDHERVFVRGLGCPECVQGHKGATVVAETIVPDARFMKLGFEGDMIGQVEYWRESLHGRPMIEHALDKVKAGLISPYAVEKSVGPIGSDGSLAEVMSLERIRHIIGRGGSV